MPPVALRSLAPKCGVVNSKDLGVVEESRGSEDVSWCECRRGIPLLFYRLSGKNTPLSNRFLVAEDFFDITRNDLKNLTLQVK